jgi:hypothetical protein
MVVTGKKKEEVITPIILKLCFNLFSESGFLWYDKGSHTHLDT